MANVKDEEQFKPPVTDDTSRSVMCAGATDQPLEPGPWLGQSCECQAARPLSISPARPNPIEQHGSSLR